MRFRRANTTQNCYSFLTQKPPLVTFCLVLLCFLLVLAYLVIYLRNHEVRNPDAHDWNTFKEALSTLDYCISQPLKENLTDVFDLDKNVNQERQSYSFEVILSIEHKMDLFNITKLYGQMSGNQIDLLSDFSTQQEILLLTYDLIHSKRSQLKFLNYLKSDFCVKNPINIDCTHLKVKTCMTINGPAKIFPKTRAPQTCYVQYDDDRAHLKSKISSIKETPDLPLHQFWCSPNDLKAKMLHKIDPNLFEMLTSLDKLLITKNLHICIGLVSFILVGILLREMLKNNTKKIYEL